MISTKISRKPVLAFAALTAVIAFLLFKYVELKPQVDEHFFFSSDDPHFQDEKKISTMFPQVPQIVVAARGNIRTPEYGKSIEDLTLDVEKLSDVFGVQSLTRGPDGVQDAIESPLWKRTLVSEDAKASFLFAFLRKNPDSEFILNLEALREKYSRPAFEVMISGAPYIVELIRRSLFRDLKIFSAAAFAIFSIALLIIFRSLWIVAGVTVACFNASALTLLIAKIVHLQTGFLTANLPTIVFVLTLSHIAFLTAEWKQLMIEAGDYRPGLAWVAARNTFSAALWSTFTALLGFLTLLFVQAQSLRQLGLSGSLGTLVALVAAYIFYPWFLEHQKKNPSFLEAERAKKTRVADFIDRRPRWVLLALLALTIFSCFALPQLDTDPSLFAYFKKNSEIRNGLEYIDRHGGSNPLSIVIEDPENTKLNDSDAYSKMWRLHLALEKDPAVGHVVSLPILLAEAKRSFIANLMKLEWLLDAMDSPRFGEVAKYFVTEDRHHSLYILRMKEQDQAEPRMNVVNRLKEVVRKQGYIPIHVGGVFMLQGRLSELVASSLISGSAFLNLVILGMTWILSRSWRASFAMLASLYFVPITMLGILAFMKIPLDVIAAPAANVAIGMGVDSMIHLMIHARRTGKGLDDPAAWKRANKEILEPILWSTLMVASGFSIFMLSDFPPTQRFGFSVVLGTLLSPLATLFILPWLATFHFPKLIKK